MKWKNERAAEVHSKLGWFFRSGRGFYFQGKKYTRVSFFDDCIACGTDRARDTVYIRYEDIVDYRPIHNDRGLLTKEIVVRQA